MLAQNTDLANLFLSIGELLKTQGANIYRMQAYRRAADTISALREPIREIATRGELESLPGIGKDLSRKIQEYLETGTIQTYEELKKPLPSEILAWAKLPGFSEPLVNDLYFRLGIRTLDDLEMLTRSHMLRTKPGIAESTDDLLKAIQALRENTLTAS